MRLIILTTILLLQFSSVLAQSATEARFVLQDIQDWLPGEYDNEAQLFVETAFGAGEEGNHPWLHLDIAAVPDSDLGEVVFRVINTRRDMPDDEAEVEYWAFSVDKERRAVLMTRHDTVGVRDSSETVLWRRGPDHVYGSLPIGNEQRRELRLTDEEFWELDESRKDEIPLRYTKVRFYECFALVHHAGGDGMTIKNPFMMHDGGDLFSFETDEAEPRTIEVLLRRSMWTSRSGNNFVPLLQIYVFENGERDSPLANAWSAAESGRVGFAARGLASARCKIPENKEN